MGRNKVRIRFSKTGTLRFISHHDLMRCFERMLRRAQLPFRSSQGFNPKPRLSFAMPLALGMIGWQEVAELELDAALAPDEIHSRLQHECPNGLQIVDVSPSNSRRPARVHFAAYRVPLPAGASTSDLQDRLRDLLDAPECWIVRERPHQRRLDLRPFILDLRLAGNSLEMDLLVTPKGTARPDEVLTWLGQVEVLEEGVVIERTAVELAEDEELCPVGFTGKDADA